MKIRCVSCCEKVEARLTSGAEIYPHRPDLKAIPFWKCDKCGNYVGCHYKTKNKTQPLGNIPTPDLREARKYIHAILDPIWKSGNIKRKDLYLMISQKCGWNYHTAQIRSIEEAREIYKIVKGISNEQ